METRQKKRRNVRGKQQEILILEKQNKKHEKYKELINRTNISEKLFDSSVDCHYYYDNQTLSNKDSITTYSQAGQ